MSRQLSNDLLTGDGDWRKTLPELYTWIRAVEINSVQRHESDSMCVILAQSSDKEGGPIVLDAPALDMQTQETLTAEAVALGWNAKSGSMKVSCGGKRFCLIAKSPYKCLETQLARQFGLDAGAAIGDSDGTPITLAISKDELAQEILFGFCNSFYPRGLFKSSNKQKLPSRIDVLETSVNKFDDTRIMVQSTTLTRYLQDCPANWLTPPLLADIAETLTAERGARVQVFGAEELLAEGMGAFLAVAKGSEFPPRMVIIDIPGSDPKSDECVALVGKGLTFDAGGISIKPAAGMDEMKYDMSGAAAVVGAALALSELKPKHRVICAIGAVENMCSGTAIRPGDVVKARNGKTVEILNTDAEGRLVLADLLAYVTDNYKPAMTINLATLTGAVIMALGHMGAAVLSNSDNVAEFLDCSGKNVGEPLWRLPLWPEVVKEVKSDIADYANITKPGVRAGTIMAGAFLREFVGQYPWAHLDIAGTAWNCSATGYPSKGGAAYGMRTIIEACLRYEGQQFKADA
jgi:leucyl aminopeptidase